MSVCVEHDPGGALLSQCHADVTVEEGDISTLTHSLSPCSLLPPTRCVDLALRVIMRAMWFCGGFHWIRVKGERASSSQAPILTLAPHSSYFDAIPVTMTMASIVARAESKSIPVWGSKDPDPQTPLTLTPRPP